MLLQVFLSTQMLRLNFCTEALRMIGRILNYPTGDVPCDTHLERRARARERDVTRGAMERGALASMPH